MLNRSLFASALMLLSTVGFAGVASANPATVTFSGTVPKSCIFDKTTASGSLFLADKNGDGKKDTLEADPTSNGTTAKLTVTCNTTASLTTGLLTGETSNPIVTLNTLSLYQQADNQPLTKEIDGSVKITADSPLQFQVGMSASLNNLVSLPAGEYKYTVQLTATAN